MGRADVLVQFWALRYLTEMKQDPDDNSRAHIKGKYLTQESEYTNTNAPFGQLLVLDLTPKTSSGGTLRVDEVAWLATHRPHGATTDRLVLAGIVTGQPRHPLHLLTLIEAVPRFLDADRSPPVGEAWR
ncbi:hypothetical protein C6Y14_43275 [Streptomyces dioscori]|uniref:Uncharacterized protein n=2 Tax=Streptomyces dioscori TaxID=2109333 RepID=A0A2P8PTF8_9ACTN|nr:hypothetical protein C6Y14_43275 [Streptomyces dioscori]